MSSRLEFAHESGALQREWLVTNGLGGFASGTVSQANTRRYHGLLVASLRPPVDRVLMLAKLDVTAYRRGARFELACNEYADGTIAPRGFERLAGFRLENGIPVWTHALGDAFLDQRLWMADDRNTTYVSFTLRGCPDSVEIEALPLCTYRDYHAHTGGGWLPQVQSDERGFSFRAFETAHPYRVMVERGTFREDCDWHWRFRHRVESERGLDASEDLYRPGVFHTSLSPGETVTFIATAEDGAPESAALSVDREIRRRQDLLEAVPADAPEWIRQLTLAADAFIVRRAASEQASAGTTVIAGYPWFTDWGRDTMIALPGLTLATGRATDAASILRTFAQHVSQGMLPNRFPDRGGSPEYNTVDATLWYFHAIAVYVADTGDSLLLREIYPVLKEIISWHRRGTRYGIHMDPADGLLHAGEQGTQLTWMDAKIGDWVVTPRIGKPVEINALWHHALLQMSRWAKTLEDAPAARAYDQAAARVAEAFSRSFWFEQGSYLYDVIDGPEGSDSSLRPNQLFAVSLGSDLLPSSQARAVVDVCSQELLTPVGLRTLPIRDTRYAATYTGGPRERDAVYHQGTVWSWLLGPFALAHFRVYRDRRHAMAVLSGLEPHLGEACVGTVSEIFDGSAPHSPRGCFAQAWSVSETLRAWHVLNRSQEPARAHVYEMVGG